MKSKKILVTGGSVYVGTRLIATHESPASEEHKQAILLAKDDSTAVQPGIGGRSLSKNFIQEIYPQLNRSFGAGQGAGLVREILSVKEVIDHFVQDFEDVMENIYSLKI